MATNRLRKVAVLVPVVLVLFWLHLLTISQVWVDVRERKARKEYLEWQAFVRGEVQVSRIYYINLDSIPHRREFMESWLSKQPVPFMRVPGVQPELSEPKCISGKQNEKRCRGIAGLVRSNLFIMDHLNVSGHTLVLEDDHWIDTQAVGQAIGGVPGDWDVIRFDCRDKPRTTFKIVQSQEVPGSAIPHPLIFRTRHDHPCDPAKEPDGRCWYCSGTHAVLYREGSVSKLRALWSAEPYDDIDCKLVTKEVNSYCVQADITKYKEFPTTIPKLHLDGSPDEPQGGGGWLWHVVWG